ncbi:MAG: indole-3-glycerol phosphate synthase TrpC [Phycisphaerae bacterium]
MPTILDRILETKRREVQAQRAATPLNQVVQAAAGAAPPRDFYAALSAPAPQGIHLIAEIKKASPSAGLICPNFDPKTIARTYAAAGASAISVLTDPTYFQGRPEHIAQVKSAVTLPVLRKDFIIDPYQIHQARMIGADAVLLIAEVLDPDTLSAFAGLIQDLGMSALIEVHQPDHLKAVLGTVDFSPNRRRLLGINNRDLTIQKTNVAHTVRLSALLPEPKPILVSESGITTRADVQKVQAAGANAILVGQTLLQSNDPTASIGQLLGTRT